MKSSSKHGRSENNRSISSKLNTLHQRLYHALNMGFRFYDYKERKWQSKDIEIQRHAIRSMEAFIDCISAETVNHPVVKDSTTDIVRALVGIFQYKSEAILRSATDVVLKIVSTVPNIVEQPYVLDLLHPLTLLLSSGQVQVSVSSATSLNLILSNLSMKKEKEVSESLRETNTVDQVVRNIRYFSGSTVPPEYFKEMTSLLSTILWRWPSCRYPVWNDAELIKVLEDISSKPDVTVQVATLNLYSAIALCGSGAKKLLENGEALVMMMAHCMGISQPHHVRVAGFQLAQCLALSEQGCLKMMALSCGPIVEAIVCGMSCWSLCTGKVARDQMFLLVEACRLALITRWEGEHHIHFWKQEIDKVLLCILHGNTQENLLSPSSLSSEKLLCVAQEVLNANMLLPLRSYVWDILGWLSTHCVEDSDPILSKNNYLDILISCACIAFVDSIREGRQISKDDDWMFRTISVSRAVLLMISSKCNYIESKARSILSEISKRNGREYLKDILSNIIAKSTENSTGLANAFQMVIQMISLTCYTVLPQYRRFLIEHGAIKSLICFIGQCLNVKVHLRRLNGAPHRHHMFSDRTCCLVRSDNWEGVHIPLFYSLWGLSELICHSGFKRNKSELFSAVNHDEINLVRMLQDICIDTASPGARWYAAYILSLLGFYGFPNKIGKKIGVTLKEKEYADMKLILTNGESFHVHGVVLMVRCPLLLPPEAVPSDENVNDSSLINHNEEIVSKKMREVHLSVHVDYQALARLLDFVYLGYLEDENELVKKLKTLAKHCKLQPLYDILCGRRPKWGAPYPNTDLTLALDPAGQKFSYGFFLDFLHRHLDFASESITLFFTHNLVFLFRDVILEAKATEPISWRCNICSMVVPHMHVHKLILWSSCDYLRALFQSGMQESHSQTVKVPVNWEALVKLVHWLYSDEVPMPPSGCLWDNMNSEEKLHELQPYLELCWLADFWLLEDVREACSQVIISCLGSAKQLSIKVIQIASKLNLWEIAKISADYMAPLYHQLRECGTLETLDEELVEMVRAASVRFSQQGGD